MNFFPKFIEFLKNFILKFHIHIFLNEILKGVFGSGILETARETFVFVAFSKHLLVCLPL